MRQPSDMTSAVLAVSRELNPTLDLIQMQSIPRFPVTWTENLL